MKEAPEMPRGLSRRMDAAGDRYVTGAPIARRSVTLP
jgi:hypothetical protein